MLVAFLIFASIVAWSVVGYQVYTREETPAPGPDTPMWKPGEPVVVRLGLLRPHRRATVLAVWGCETRCKYVIRLRDNTTRSVLGDVLEPT